MQRALRRIQLRAGFVAEPGCWRSFYGVGGVRTTLKPDGLAVVALDGGKRRGKSAQFDDIIADKTRPIFRGKFLPQCKRLRSTNVQRGHRCRNGRAAFACLRIATTNKEDVEETRAFADFEERVYRFVW